MAATTTTPAECSLSPESFARFAQYITSELGIKMPEAKLALVQSRILRRVRELRLDSAEQYAEYFFSSANKEEREQFINVITTHKTDFFREAEHFTFLVRHALPRLATATGRSRRPLHAWSAGCSTGEEPYTLAMVLSDYASQCKGFDFAILGTDVSTDVLKHAQQGIYQESQIEPVPPEMRRKYLLQSRKPDDQRVRVVPHLRQKVSFHGLNFMDTEYCVQDTFEVIFFRNVMIYFDKSTQEAVFNKLCRNLAPGGYLFVGHSESVASLDIPVVPVATSVYQKPV